MSDEQLTCSDCNTSFTFTNTEQSFYTTKQLSWPKRCKACRDQRRAQNGAKGAAPRDRAPRGRDGDRGAFRARDGAPREGGTPRGESRRFSGTAARPAPRERFDAPKERAPAKAPAGKPARRESVAKPARPMFDVVCTSCGAAAQVPFEPAAGRDIFCQPCYRSRRKPASGTLESATVAPDDSGIIE